MSHAQAAASLMGAIFPLEAVTRELQRSKAEQQELLWHLVDLVALRNSMEEEKLKMDAVLVEIKEERAKNKALLLKLEEKSDSSQNSVSYLDFSCTENRTTK